MWALDSNGVFTPFGGAYQLGRSDYPIGLALIQRLSGYPGDLKLEGFSQSIDFSNATVSGTVGALVGYWQVKVNGAERKIPVYNP